MAMPFDESKVYTSPYAKLNRESKGRLKPLASDGYRTDFQRDVHRIMYSQAFRRLRHKTQVFFFPNNDHISTRMEHVLHVASASRTVARHLRLNEDLTEAIGLGHDLGHSPFGHHGEKVLNRISEEKGLDISFQHEIHGLRVVDKIAVLDREPRSGLNLTYEVRDGIISHCGEDFKSNFITPEKGPKELESIKSRSEALMPVTLEGCIVRFVDKITYSGRDLEDALKAKLIVESDIPKDITAELGRNNGEIIGNLLEDLIDSSQSKENRIGLSKAKFEALNALIKFNYEKIYNHEKVERFKIQAGWALEALFERLLKELERSKRFNSSVPLDIPVLNLLNRYIKKINYSEDEKDEVIVLDFIAGMTDNYVIECVNELFVPKYIV